MSTALSELLTQCPHAKSLAISSPSGGGKSTIIRFLQQQIPNLAFSVSACSRDPRPGEIDGVHYYFKSVDEFKRMRDEGLFLECEEVFPGFFYGTPLSELTRLWGQGSVIVFDVDVRGALNLKRLMGTRVFTVFLKPPSMQILEQRLRARRTETDEVIKKRLQRAQFEETFADQFDASVVNDRLEQAQQEVLSLVKDYIG